MPLALLVYINNRADRYTIQLTRTGDKTLLANERLHDALAPPAIPGLMIEPLARWRDAW
jgi:hypothetical protein